MINIYKKMPITNKRVKREGFILAEAILALSLIATSTVFRAQEEGRLNDISRAQEFAVDLGQVAKAIDKRVFLDGVKHPTGAWDQSWDSTEKVVNRMIGFELVGKDNPDCGDAANGWAPVMAANSVSSLVTCNLFNPKRLPFNFDMTAKRVGSTTSPSMISEWSFNLFHTSPDEFQQYFHLYPQILRKIKLHHSIDITGTITAKTVNRLTDEEITMSGCQSINSLCAIQVKYQTSTSPLLGEDVYLRVDGSNAMRNTLRFSSGASVAQCYTQDSPTTVKKTECGLDFDVTDDSLDVISDLVYTSGMRLVQSQNEAPVVVTCKDEGGANVYCGVTTVATPSSVTSSAYLNSIVANDFMALTNSSGVKVFDVDDQGDVNTKGKVDIGKELHVRGSAELDSLLNVKGDTVLGSKLNVGGDTLLGSKLNVKGDSVLGSKLNVGGDTLLGSKINAKGDAVLGSKLNVGGDTVLGSKLNVKGDSVFEGNTNINKVLTVFSDASFKRNIVTDGTSTSKLSVAGTFRASQKVSLGASCDAHNIGDFTANSAGEMLSCQNKATPSGTKKIWASVVESVPIGTISIWPKGTPPSGWIECKGQSLTSYPLLKALIGSNAPDLRGVFVRGWDHSRGLDSGRTLGSYQDDADQLWKAKWNADDRSGRWPTGIAKSAWNRSGGGADGGDSSSVDVTLDNSRNIRTANESRPKNVALMYIIKYR